MATTSALPERIRAHHDEILASWEAGVRTLPGAANVPPKVLFDGLPDFLDWVAGRLESGDEGDATEAERDEFAIRHARGRLALGFDIVELVSELTLLRDAVLALWEAEPSGITPRDVRRFDEEIDHAVALCAVEFVRALPAARANESGASADEGGTAAEGDATADDAPPQAAGA